MLHFIFLPRLSRLEVSLLSSALGKLAGLRARRDAPDALGVVTGVSFVKEPRVFASTIVGSTLLRTEAGASGSAAYEHRFLWQVCKLPTE